MTPDEIQEDRRQKEELDNQAEVKRQQEVEFYAASVNAWFNTALEHDKSIFTLSAGGVGLLVTLMTGVSTSVMLHLYILAIVCFLVSLCMVLVIFRRNRTHIEQVLSGESQLDPVLSILDIGGKVTFAIGMVLTAIIGISAASASYESKKKEIAMANEKQVPATGAQMVYDSVNGLGTLQKSFNNVGALQPKPSTQPASSTQQPPATPKSSDSSK